jgi:hypothetical protein
MDGGIAAAAIGGATAMGCAVAGLVFLRHWSRTRDRLFAFFAASFWTMAINRMALVAIGDGREPHTWAYLVRLLAFLLILVGIVEKNLARQDRAASGSD